MTTYLSNYIKNNSNLLLIFLVLLLNTNSFGFYYLDLFLYIFLHVAILYQILYLQNRFNYYYIFIIGFILDVSLINNFGPHLLSLIFLFFIYIRIKKFIYTNNLFIETLLNIITIFTVIIIEKIIAYYLFGIIIYPDIILKTFIVLILFTYPIQYFLNLINSNK